RACVVHVVRAFQITRLWVKALDVSCWIFPSAFASELVDPRDFLGSQTIFLRVIANRERTEIIRKNQNQIRPVFLHYRPNGRMRRDQSASAIRRSLDAGLDDVAADVNLGRWRIN